ncbi:DUF192 domain-containing protein [Halostella sp. PRR32]|uniref:DUF192 domain-containing protein n=1 Tax=Halostella sp. PRR32 TaxID=3098147 RepID=UPI002B1E28BF|nr:DUF192 domain-containing protein [Halostella sp. PRR32]
MRLVHDPGSGGNDSREGEASGESDCNGPIRTLATNVETADSFGTRLRGLMFRSEVPADYALVFPFDGTKRRGIHTLFVRVPIDVIWVDDGTVTRVETLAPWRSVATATADTIVELAAGGAADVNAGDTVRIDA